jgi:glycosyltransferase involved in cell wall biosynthesis
MKLSVVICTYNREKYLIESLKALSSQTLSQEEFEILIVDNNSSDSTKILAEEYISSHKNARYIFVKEQGLSHARNAGYKEALTENILYLDDDASLNPEGIENLADFIESNPDACIIGGRAVIKYPDKKPEWVTKPVVNWLGSYDYGSEIIEVTSENIKKKIVRLPIGCCFFVKKSILIEIKGFNPKTGRIGNKMLAGEETLISKYALKNNKGKIFYFPGIKVDHAIDPNWLNQNFLLNKTYFYGISDVYVHFLSEKRLVKHLKYLIFRLIFLMKNTAELELAIIFNNKQKQFETKLLLNFNKGIILYFLKYTLGGKNAGTK